MQEDQGKIVRDTAEAIEGVAKAVPIYQDLVRPAAQEVGTVLARTVHAALAPLRGLVWGVEQIEEYLYSTLAEKLKRVPNERIQTPEPTIAGPALEALRFAGKEPVLREMYANLLATAMDREMAERAHPAFVDIIRQLAPDEAKILRWIVAAKHRARPVINVYSRDKEGVGQRGVLRHFSLLGVEAGCEHPHLTSNYLENLCRLALMEMPEGRSYADKSVYEPLENHPEVLALKKQIETDGRVPWIAQEAFDVTTFGVQFLNASVIEPS